MTRLVHLLEIVGFTPVGVQDLHEHRLAEIQELILFKVFARIRFLRVEIVLGDPI